MKRLEISIQSPTKTLQFPEVRLNRGLATYIDKEKALDYLHHSALNAEALSNPRLISTTNIIQNFQNPKIEASPKEKEIYRNENAAEQISGSDNSHLYARLLSTTNVIQNLPNPKVSTKNSLITPEMDASYLDAVERGDMATAQPKNSLQISAEELAEIEAERNSIIETSKANGTYLKAPNGKDTKLTPEQWVDVRTSRFKKWFGDWELAAQKVDVVNITKHHIFDVSKKVQDVKRDAIDYAKSNGIIRTMSNDETGGKGEIIIAPKAICKIVDDAYGSRPNIHIMLDAIAYLPKLIKESKLAEEHLSYEKGEDDVRRPENGINPKESIFRYYGAIAKEGKVYRTKITIKRDNGNQSQRAYTYEVMKIELTSGNTDSKKEDVPTLDNSISFAKLLQNVENDNKNGEKILDSSKIVDENGEPKIVWHGGQFGISSFIPKRNMHFGTKKAAMQRILDEQWGYDNWLIQNEDGSYSWEYEDEFIQGLRTFAKYFGDKQERDRSEDKATIEETFGGIWIENTKEFAKFVSAVNKSPFEEDGEGIAYTDNYFYAYYRNINGEPVPYASVYMNEHESQDIVNEIIRDGREKKTAREWFDWFNAHARNVKSKNDAVVGSDKKARNTRTNGRLDSELPRFGAYYDSPELFVKSTRTYKGRGVNYSLITPEMDASYLDAVERGDMATAQRMVMEAAEREFRNTKTQLQ